MPREADNLETNSNRVHEITGPAVPSGGALDGITVLDLSAYIAGPYGCALLADLGAEVVKIEPPGGDNLRQYPSTLPGENRGFVGVNRSKYGVALDLKKPEGQAVLARLAGKADVLVHNFRPSVPERVGADYERIRQFNPRIIYCAFTGYGETGPLKDKAGYDQVLQSLTGICTFQGGAEGPPQVVLGSIVDFYGASMIAFAVTAALYHRQRTGEGQYISLSLLSSALSVQSTRFIWADGEERTVNRDMRSGGITGIHPAESGYLYISANTPRFWRSLCELVGLPDMADDPDFDSVKKRADRAAEIVPRIRKALQQKSAREWEELFGDRVPCCAVRSIDEMFDHPQVLAEGLVKSFEHPVIGRYRGITNPINFSATPCRESFSAPTLGQHTVEVLRRYGYSNEEVTQLRQLGVIPS